MRSAILATVLLTASLWASGSTIWQSQPQSINGAFQTMPQEFRRIHALRTLSDDRTIVIDNLDDIAYVADWRGTSVRPFGRKGDGPGEYRELGKLFALGGDTSIIEDPSTRKYFRLLGTTFGEQVNQRIVYTTDVAFSGADRFGNFLEVRPVVFGQSKVGGTPQIRAYAESLVVVRSKLRGEREDTLRRVRGRYVGDARLRKHINGSTMTYLAWGLLSAEDQAHAFPDGWIAVVTSAPYRVLWYPPTGAAILGQTLTVEKVRVDEAQRKAAIERRWGKQVGQHIQSNEIPGWPTELPPFQADALIPFPTGSLAIERTPDARYQNREYDVVDRKGVLQRRLRTAARERIVAFDDNFVYTAFKNEDDMEYLRRRPFK